MPRSKHTAALKSVSKPQKAVRLSALMLTPLTSLQRKPQSAREIFAKQLSAM